VGQHRRDVPLDVLVEDPEHARDISSREGLLGVAQQLDVVLRHLSSSGGWNGIVVLCAAQRPTDHRVAVKWRIAAVVSVMATRAIARVPGR
jgi:hypothetical protein